MQLVLSAASVLSTFVKNEVAEILAHDSGGGLPKFLDTAIPSWYKLTFLEVRSMAPNSWTYARFWVPAILYERMEVPSHSTIPRSFLFFCLAIAHSDSATSNLFASFWAQLPKFPDTPRTLAMLLMLGAIELANQKTNKRCTKRIGHRKVGNIEKVSTSCQPRGNLCLLFM